MRVKPSYELLSYDDPTQRERWRSICNSFENIDIYYFPEYLKLFSLHEDGKPYLFVYYESSKDLVIFPFLMRSLKGLPEISNMTKDLFDITSPYGYGGYLRNNNSIDMEIFYLVFHEFCQNNNIVSEFIRFHPILNNILYVPEPVTIKKNNETVVIYLFEEEDKIWTYMTSRCRNSIRKALKNNIYISHDIYFEKIDIFYQLYINTMKHLKAHNYYFFTKEWFSKLLHLLKNNLSLFHAYYNGEIIASAIFIYNKYYINYFLTGSLYDMRHLAANNLLLYEVALWARKLGMKYFHLGGGYHPNDSLFHFKASFSPHHANYYVGSKIHNMENYDYLCGLRLPHGMIQEKSNYFPLYRIPQELECKL